MELNFTVSPIGFFSGEEMEWKGGLFFVFAFTVEIEKLLLI